MNKTKAGLSPDNPKIIKSRPRKNGRSARSSRSREEWLAAINAISGLIVQSLDIRQVLKLAANKTMEVMDVDAILIFILDDEAQELSLEISKGVSEEFVAGVSRMKVSEGFNGTVAKTGKPLLVEDATTNPLLSRQVVVTEGIRSQLIVPLPSNGKVLGTVCVARRTLDNFNTEEVELLSSVGNAIGAAMGNAYLHQEMRHALTQLQRSEENLNYYLQQVTRAQEEERKRIARELHDEILQRLIAISRQLENITSNQAAWEESLQTARNTKKQVELAIQEMRRFARDLRPSILDDLGLLPAIDLLSDELEKRGITTSFKIIGEAKRLQPEVETMLFRIAQEASTNIWRHSEASAAELMIQFRESFIRLSIKDNGKGFNAPQKPGDMTKSGKLGLVGMQERTKLLGGTLTLQSKPGKGTVVIVDVPLKRD